MMQFLIQFILFSIACAFLRKRKRQNYFLGIFLNASVHKECIYPLNPDTFSVTIQIRGGGLNSKPPATKMMWRG